MNKYRENTLVHCYKRTRANPYVYFYDDCSQLIDFKKHYDSGKSFCTYLGTFITPTIDQLNVIAYCFNPDVDTFIYKEDAFNKDNYRDNINKLMQLIRGMYEDHISYFIASNKTFHDIWYNIHNPERCFGLTRVPVNEVTIDDSKEVLLYKDLGFNMFDYFHKIRTDDYYIELNNKLFRIYNSDKTGNIKWFNELHTYLNNK